MGPIEKQTGRKLQIYFREGDDWRRHTSGINRILTTSDEHVFTASRDSTAKRWNVESTSGRMATYEVSCEASYEGHSDWINDITRIDDLIITASSDRMVRCWKADARGMGRCLQVLPGHTDYVQCVSATQNGTLLASAGLMSEVFLWDLTRLKPVASLGARNADSSPISRATLDALEDCQMRPAWRPAPPPGSQQDASALMLKGSVYAMAVEPAAARVVACGATDGLIRIYDPRAQDAQQLVCKLRGHTDNVRCLLLDERAQLLLSASSDHTIRLWDLGQQRCVQTYRAHEDAVWSLAIDSRTGTIYSGGRDKTVRRINLATKAWDVLCETDQPVRSLALGPDGLLWVGTTNAHLAAYDTAAAEATARERVQASGASAITSPMRRPSSVAQSPGNQLPSLSLGDGALGRPSGGILQSPPTHGGPSPLMNRVWGGASASREAGAAPAPSLGSSLASRVGLHLPGQPPRPLVEAPKLLVRGQAPLVQAVVLENRQHVLCRDMEGRVTLWDVTLGQVVQDLGQADFKRTLEALFRPEVVPSWFSTDTRLGCLGLRLDPCTCFSAEVYAVDLGISHSPDDKKLNYADAVVVSLFRPWKVRYLKRLRAGDRSAPQPPPGLEPSPDSGMEDDEPLTPRDEARSSSGMGATPSSQRGPGASPLPASPGSISLSVGPGSSGRAPNPPQRLIAPFQYSQLPNVPVLMCETDDGRPWRCPMDALDGTEPLGEVLPLWVYNSVVRGEFPTALMSKYAAQNQNKLTFELQPAEGSGLPELQQPSLSAPRILKISKVLNYTVSKLAEQQVPLSTGPSPDLIVMDSEGERVLVGGIRRPMPLLGADTTGPTAPAPLPKKLPFEAGSSMDAVMSTPSQANLLPTLELLCNGQAVPHSLTLAGVKKYLCKGGDVVFQFRVKQPNLNAPLPKFVPPQIG